MQPPPVRQCFRGADYQAVLNDMRRFTELRSEQTPDELWQVEHVPVFTLGQAGKQEHLLNPGNIPVVVTERGGQVTYHGPGQVVIYTLVDLRRQNIFVREWVCHLEQAMINTLARFSIPGACRKPSAPGVYVPESGGLSKIGAVGLKVSRGRAYHGIALNVELDLSPFQRINPCCYPGLRTVVMATMGSHPTWQEVANYLCDQIEI